MTRVYIPVDAARLTSLRDSGLLGPAPLAAHAVTPALRASLPGADEEEVEYSALLTAAGVPVQGRPAVVVAADVPEAALSVDTPEGSSTGSRLTQVTVREAVPMARVAAFHVEELEPTADEDVLGDLLWYDRTEMDQVLALL